MNAITTPHTLPERISRAHQDMHYYIRILDQVHPQIADGLRRVQVQLFRAEDEAARLVEHIPNARTMTVAPGIVRRVVA